MKYYVAVIMKYAVFNGRATRAEFWYFTLFNFVFVILLSLIGMALDLGSTDPLTTIYGLFILCPHLAVWVRRMHDIDKSGWFLLIPIYNYVLACEKGTHGSNEYGPDPDIEEFSN